jgi:hypothetical protein
MPTLNDVKSDRPFSLFKGEPGTRKSTQALSYPKPIYYLDFDQKIDALIQPAQKWAIDKTLINYDKFSSFSPEKNWNAAIRKLEQLQLNCPHKTIVVDSITTAADLMNRQTIRLKDGTTGKSGQEKGIRIGGIAVNTMEDYKAEASGFQEMLALLKDINEYHGTNIILIAHVIGERNAAEKAQSTHFARIIVTGGKIISAKIPAYCSEIYHFGVDNTKIVEGGAYEIRTQHSGDDYARTSLPLPAKIQFTGEPLYGDFILPAIERLKQNK